MNVINEVWKGETSIGRRLEGDPKTVLRPNGGRNSRN